jgi:hypothetical protein
MKLSFGILILTAHGAMGAVLKSTFLSKTSSSSSAALRFQSEALDRALQSIANKLEPGYTRDFLKTLRLCAPCNHFERLGEANDGGYVTCTDGLDKGLVGALSYGINGFDGWGMAVASKYKIPLNEYDCTNPNVPEVCEGCKVNFHNECILDAKGVPHGDYKTLSQQLKESGNGNAKDRSLLLKIDVEAAEWKIFAEEPVENMKKFREIVVEYHWINQEDNHQLYLQAVKRIEDAGFAVAHLHGNNYGGDLQQFGEFSIPNVLEVTYIQKPSQGCAADIPYRIDLDMPNNVNSPELGDAVLPTKL